MRLHGAMGHNQLFDICWSKMESLITNQRTQILVFDYKSENTNLGHVRNILELSIKWQLQPPKPLPRNSQQVLPLTTATTNIQQAQTIAKFRLCMVLPELPFLYKVCFPSMLPWSMYGGKTVSLRRITNLLFRWASFSRSHSGQSAIPSFSF